MTEFVGNDMPVVGRKLAEDGPVQHGELRLKIREGTRAIVQIPLLKDLLPTH
jgi:hypothetical protein